MLRLASPPRLTPRDREVFLTHGLTPGDFRPNRRGEERTALARRLDVLPCAATGDWKFLVTEMTDCSPHGLGILAAEPMAVGAQFLVKLRVGGSVRMLLYTVRNCAPADRARHRIGARFSGLAATELNEDPAEVLRALLEPQ